MNEQPPDEFETREHSIVEPEAEEPFYTTLLSLSPFAGIERPPTTEWFIQLERERKWLLAFVVGGLACIVVAGCATLLMLFVVT